MDEGQQPRKQPWRTYGPERSQEAVVFVGTSEDWGHLPRDVGFFAATVVIDLASEPEPTFVLDAVVDSHALEAHLVLHEPADVCALAWADRNPDRHSSTLLVSDSDDPEDVLAELRARVTVD